MTLGTKALYMDREKERELGAEVVDGEGGRRNHGYGI